MERQKPRDQSMNQGRGKFHLIGQLLNPMNCRDKMTLQFATVEAYGSDPERRQPEK
jgi:hypothetical protein